MPDTVLYVYAIAREATLPEEEGVDATRHFGTAEAAGIAAVFTRVPREAFSQEAIDARAKEL